MVCAIDIFYSHLFALQLRYLRPGRLPRLDWYVAGIQRFHVYELASRNVALAARRRFLPICQVFNMSREKGDLTDLQQGSVISNQEKGDSLVRVFGGLLLLLLWVGAVETLSS